jgi:hypothetical protein
MNSKLILIFACIAILNVSCEKTKSQSTVKDADPTQVLDASAWVITSKELNSYKNSSPEARRAALQKLVDEAASKNLQLVLPEGEIVISDEIILPPNLWLEGSGTKTQISLTPGSNKGRNLFRIPTRTNNIRLKNIQLNSNLEGNTGADLVTVLVADNVSNLTFDHVTFVGGRDRGTVQVKGLNDYQVKNIQFSNCTFLKAGRTSLELRGTNGVLISNCVFSEWGSQNENSPAIQLQSQENVNVRISGNTFNNLYGKQFAVESAAAYVSDGKIEDNKFNDPNNLGGNGISGYYKHTLISKNIFSGGSGNHRSGMEIFGQYNTISDNEISRGSIAIAPGIKEAGLAIRITNNKIKTSGENVGGIQVGGGCCGISDVNIISNVVDTRLSTGNSSGIVVGTYGTPQVVKQITVQANTIYTNAHCIRLQSLPGSRDIRLSANKLKSGYTWLGVITDTFENVKATGNVNELSNESISYSGNIQPISEN